MRMQRLSLADYQNLVNGGRTLAEDAYGPKVIETRSGDIVKIFRVKRAFSSARLKSYALRFVDNAERLRRLGILTIAPKGAFRVENLSRDIVLYRPLPGISLRELLSRSSGDDDAELLRRFARFVSRLHDHGILFRSIHFGNVVYGADGKFGLIDVADLRIRWFARALTTTHRVRNFRHMLRYAEDRAALEKFGPRQFIVTYTGQMTPQATLSTLEQGLLSVLAMRS